MNNNQLIEQLSLFISEQKCFRHQNEKAKMINLNSNFKETFICSYCTETDNRNYDNLLSVKRAALKISNFILYSSINHKVSLNQHQKTIASFKEKQKSINESLTKFIEQLETQFGKWYDRLEKIQKNYDRKLFEIEKYALNYLKLNSFASGNQVEYGNNLLSSLLALLQNETLMSVCQSTQYETDSRAHEEKSNMIDAFLKQTQDNLSSIRIEVAEPVQNQTLTKLFKTQSLANLDFLKTGSLVQQSQFVSTFSSQLLSPYVANYQFGDIHDSMKLKSPTQLNIPLENNEKYPGVRLGFISPKLQDGPLKPPKSITFQIESQIMQIICLGVCNNTNREGCLLNPKKEKQPFILFNSQGIILSNQISDQKCPVFNRGDVVTLVVNTQTSYIQVIKNRIFNQPFQVDLPNSEKWVWSNLAFCVGVYGKGGADISIVK